MPEQKPNRRVQFTKSALRKALLELITEKPLQSITVTDICARADINRSTFYLHYKDTRGLLEDIENEILAHIAHFMSYAQSLNFDTSLLISRLSEIKNSPDIQAVFRALISEQGDPQFMHRLQAIGYEAFSRAWEHRIPDFHEKIKPLVYDFLVAGITAVIATWIEGKVPDMSTEEITHFLKMMVEHGISSLAPDQ